VNGCSIWVQDDRWRAKDSVYQDRAQLKKVAHDCTSLGRACPSTPHIGLLRCSTRRSPLCTTSQTAARRISNVVHKYAQGSLAYRYNFGGRCVSVSTSASATTTSNCRALKRMIVRHASASRNKRPEPVLDLKHTPTGKSQMQKKYNGKTKLSGNSGICS